MNDWNVQKCGDIIWKKMKRWFFQGGFFCFPGLGLQNALRRRSLHYFRIPGLGPSSQIPLFDILCGLNDRTLLLWIFYDRKLVLCKFHDSKMLSCKLYDSKQLSCKFHDSKLLPWKLHDSKLLSCKLNDKIPLSYKLHNPKLVASKLHESILLFFQSA